MKNRKQLWFVLVIIFIVISACLVFFGGVTRGPLIADGIALYRTVLADKPTSQGFVYIPFRNTSDEFAYLNIAVDVNGDGAILAYDTPNGKQEEWVVQNDFPEILEGDANRFAIDVIDERFGASPISGIAVLSKEAFPAGTWSQERAESEKEQKSFLITEIIPEVRDLHMTLDPTGKLATGRTFIASARVAHAQATPPAASGAGDYYWFHADVPDQNQLWNECAPTAISNSFRWLAKKYGLEGHMPQGDVNDLIDEIKGDLAWNDGVAHGNIISGKQTFITRHGLPIEAHQIGGTDDFEIVKKINAELEKGQAVEAWLSFYDESGHPAGAHLVTVVGAGHKNGKDIIRFTDPDTLGAPSRDAYDVEAGNMLPRYMPGGQTYITYAYAQSPIPSLVDKTWVDPRNDTAVAVGGGGIPLTAPEEDVTLSRSLFGFFSTSVGHPGDHYVGDTFAVHAAVFKTGKEREVNFINSEGEESVWKHKAEKPWSLAGTWHASGAVSPALTENAPPTTALNNERFAVEGKFTCTAPGFATIAYSATIGWTSSGIPPPEIKRFTHGSEFESTSDTMRVESPTFRCIAKAVAAKEEARTAPPTEVCAGVAEDPNGKPIDVLKVGNECYPTLQFHQANADKCDATHWHANAGTARSLTGTTWIDPSGCGLGRVSEVGTAQIKLSPDQAAPYIDSVHR